MPELSNLRLGADVFDKDGQKAGTLVSVLVEHAGFDPKALVVKDDRSLVSRLISEEKLLVTDEVVIPIEAVESTAEDGVRLSMSGAEIRRQKPYLSYRFEPETEAHAVLEEVEVLGGGLGMPQLDEVANKPAAQIEIERDENVMLGGTGRRLGRVQELLYDKGELIGIVVKPEGFFKHDVVLPIRFITRADDMALFAELDESSIRQLKPFEESH